MFIKDITILITSKADIKQLSAANYISTENMLPNFAGIKTSSTVANIATAFQSNDILISNIRPYFKKIWFATFNGGCSKNVICLRVNNLDCLPKYLFYLLNTDNFINTFVASSKGTTMPCGDKQALMEYEFNLPPLAQQRHIVDTMWVLC